MLYEQKYNESDFLEALGDGFRTLGGITRKVGCARMTCINYINRLIQEGRVEKITVDDGFMFVYRKI
jgi:hypothetical protein